MKLLVAYDGSLSSEAAVENMQQAGLPREVRTLVLCGSSDTLPGTELHSLTETACARIQTQFPQWELSSQALQGLPAESILKTSRWWRPDLLIIGAEAFPGEHARTASVSLELVHRARCSVRLVRTRKSAMTGPIRLAIGNNGSKACEAIVYEVARRHWPADTEAHVITVIDSPAQDHQHEDFIHRLREAGLTVNRKLIPGDPRQELVRESERSGADAIFVGPRCLPAVGRFLLGSVATAAVTRARTTVEVVRR